MISFPLFTQGTPRSGGSNPSHAWRGSSLLAGSLLSAACLPVGATAAEEPAAQGATVLRSVEVKEEVEDSYLAEAATIASKTPHSRREIANSVSVLTRAQMDDQNLVTMWDALQQMTGVQAISNDITQAQYHARGTALELQRDGMPSSMPLSGYQQFDLSIYERIEVQRGPAGLLQGSGNFGGTVNLVRKRPTAELGGALLASFGSWNNLRAEGDFSSALNESGTLRARAVGSFIDREYVFDRLDDRKRLGYLAVDYDLAPSTTVGTYFAWQDDHTPGFSGLPTYTNGQHLDVSRSFNPYPEWNRYAWRTIETGLELQHAFNADWQLTARTTRLEQDFLFHDSYPNAGINPTTNTTTYARREAVYDYGMNSLDTFLTGGFELFGRRHELLFGYNQSRFLSTGRGENPNQNASLNVPNVPLADPPSVPEPQFTYRFGSQSRTAQRGFYSQLRANVIEPVTVLLGARLTHFDADSRTTAPSAITDWTQGAKENREPSPYAGLVWNLTRRLTAYASYADVFAPQTQKRVSGEVLDPRVGRQLEAGLKADLASNQLHAALAVFNIRDRNRAYADPANTGFFLPLGLAESEGAELEVVGRPLRNWDISTGYTYLKTSYLKHQSLQGQPLSYWYPRHELKLWTSYLFTGGMLSGLRVGGGVNAYSKAASGTSTPTVAARTQSGYAVASLQAAYTFTPQLLASITVNNLFDRHYYTRLGGTNTYNTFGDPRNGTLALRWSF